MDQSTCRRCGEEILWLKSATSGSNVACNPVLDHHSVSIYDVDGHRLPSGFGRVCHWDTCKQSATKSPPEKPRRAEDCRSTVLVAIAQTFNLDEVRGIRTEMSRLIGIMDRAGVDSESPNRVRTMLGDAMSQGWGIS